MYNKKHGRGNAEWIALFPDDSHPQITEKSEVELHTKIIATNGTSIFTTEVTAVLIGFYSGHGKQSNYAYNSHCLVANGWVSPVVMLQNQGEKSLNISPLIIYLFLHHAQFNPSIHPSIQHINPSIHPSTHKNIHAHTNMFECFICHSHYHRMKLNFGCCHYQPGASQSTPAGPSTVTDRAVCRTRTPTHRTDNSSQRPPSSRDPARYSSVPL